MKKHIPNALTLLRILLVPVVWWCIWQREYEKAILSGFFAGISDALDGYLARRWNATSRFGALADPIADKLLLSGSYLMFWLAREIAPWIAAIVIGRDLLILGVALIAWRFTRLRDFPPSVWGKVSTLIQILTGLVILVNRSIGSDIYTYRLEWWMLYACAAVTLWSGIHYAGTVWKRMRPI